MIPNFTLFFFGGGGEDIAYTRLIYSHFTLPAIKKDDFETTKSCSRLSRAVCEDESTYYTTTGTCSDEVFEQQLQKVGKNRLGHSVIPHILLRGYVFSSRYECTKAKCRLLSTTPQFDF